MIIDFTEKVKSASMFAGNAAESTRRGDIEQAEREAEAAAKWLAELTEGMTAKTAQSLDDATMQEVKTLVGYARYISLVRAFANADEHFMIVEDLLHGLSSRLKALAYRLQ